MNAGHSFGIVVFTRNNKYNSKLSDIYVRITVDGRRSEFSLKEQIVNVNLPVFLACSHMGVLSE